MIRFLHLLRRVKRRLNLPSQFNPNDIIINPDKVDDTIRQHKKAKKAKKRAVIVPSFRPLIPMLGIVLLFIAYNSTFTTIQSSRPVRPTPLVIAPTNDAARHANMLATEQASHIDATLYATSAPSRSNNAIMVDDALSMATATSSMADTHLHATSAAVNAIAARVHLSATIAIQESDVALELQIDKAKAVATIGHVELASTRDANTADIVLERREVTSDAGMAIGFGSTGTLIVVALLAIFGQVDLSGLRRWFDGLQEKFRRLTPEKYSSSKESGKIPEQYQDVDLSWVTKKDSLIDVLVRQQRLMFIGATQSGKTTLARTVFSRRAIKHQVIVLDSSPRNNWGKLRVIGRGKAFGDLEDFLTSLTERINDDSRKMAQNSRYNPKPLYILIDECPTIVKNVPVAREAIHSILEDGRHVGVFVSMMAVSDDVKSLGLEGSVQLKDAFCHVRITKNSNTDRTADVKIGENTTRYAIPMIKDSPRRPVRAARQVDSRPTIDGDFTPIPDDYNLSADLLARLPEAAQAILSGSNLSNAGMSGLLNERQVQELKGVMNSNGFGIQHNGKPYTVTPDGETFLSRFTQS